MRVAIDTNRYSDFARGISWVVEVLERADRVFVPLMVLAELLAGFSVGKRGAQNEGTLRRFLARPGVDVLLPDETTAHHYASLYRQLRRHGTPIPTNDLWIASLVVQHDLALLDRDSHFDSLPQLVRVETTEP
ncbi:MAG: type II toxin-antitoxin system VapC family toxin [Deltaproteobacteria bacterium]|nr:type II toxin-antitoxin system VapC family toxin [Deltaproteobacteria bacterium]